MTQPTDPYWVQIEFSPRGSETAFIQLNLALIMRVQVQRKDREIIGAVIRYPDETLKFGPEEAKSFLVCWNDYMCIMGGLNYKDEEAEPGLIHMPETFKELKTVKK